MEHFSPKIVKAVETVKTSPSVQRAFDYVKEHLEETIRDQKELVLIEAPTGHEKAKAERYLSMLREAGLDDIYMDEHFNVIGKLHGTGNTGCSVLLEGHLDTVFSFGDVKGIETDAEGRIHCPGICDDTRAIAANLAVLRAFKAANLRPVHDIYFCGTVCEEGLGGMKGMAWTLDQLKDKTKLLATISIDGATAEIFYANATGMIDLEVTIEGPGGHAWTACERVSAIRAVAQAISEPQGMQAVNLQVAEKYVEAFGKIAKEGNTLLLPANLADMGSMVASAMTIIREQNGKQAAAPAVRKAE